MADPFKDYVVRNRTQMIQLRLESDPKFAPPDAKAPYGYYQGRPLIGHDAPINGGVYLGKHHREAIVVDDQKFPLLKKVYAKLEAQIFAKPDAKPTTAEILRAVCDQIRKYLPFNDEKTEALVAEYNTANDRKIALDDFIAAQTGVCRHQALLAGYLLERLIKEGKLQGKVSVDRNRLKAGGTHAWTRYTAPDGKVFIIDGTQDLDGTQGLVAPLEEAVKDNWLYHREEDEIFGGL